MVSSDRILLRVNARIAIFKIAIKSMAPSDSAPGSLLLLSAFQLLNYKITQLPILRNSQLNGFGFSVTCNL